MDEGTQEVRIMNGHVLTWVLLVVVLITQCAWCVQAGRVERMKS